MIIVNQYIMDFYNNHRGGYGAIQRNSWFNEYFKHMKK